MNKIKKTSDLRKGFSKGIVIRKQIIICTSLDTHIYKFTFKKKRSPR